MPSGALEGVEMLLACWSSKGGSGTTVVSVALASLLASRGSGSLLVDLAGDVPAVLGMADADGPGVAEWLAAGPSVPADGLQRLEVAAPGGLRVVRLGAAPAPPGPRADVLAALLAADRRVVVADCGTSPTGVALAVAIAAQESVLVVRPCYLALRRAHQAVVRPTAVVLVREAHRALSAAEVEDALGAPVIAEVPVHEVIARAVDSGTLGHRLPRTLQRSLRHVA